MSKIFYLARSYAPLDGGGGSLMRKGAVEELKKLGWDVKVIRPNYDSVQFCELNDITLIPFSEPYNQKKFSLFERIGIYEDYLDPWINSAFKYLSSIVRPSDIIFATSGGELGMIKLGALLKKRNMCKLVINFRDPLNYGFMCGMRRDKKPHIGRQKIQRKYLRLADLILTSSKKYSEILEVGFPEIKSKLYNNYFGYYANNDDYRTERKNDEFTTIAYAGNMSSTQAPFFILDALRDQCIENLKIVFIGDTVKKKINFQRLSCSVEIKESMPHAQLQTYMSRNVDVGLVSLSKTYFGACVPSKIYEYISLGLPMLGFLPPGDAENIINENKFGVATRWGDIQRAQLSIKKIMDYQYREDCKTNLVNERERWAMKIRIKDVDEKLRKLVHGTSFK